MEGTIGALRELVEQSGVPADAIEGISFSGQMHGLVLLDAAGEPVRNAILWNDTRTTAECREIEALVGQEQLLTVTRNPALEGFTLPKFFGFANTSRKYSRQAVSFLLPKDYVRYRLTGECIWIIPMQQVRYCLMWRINVGAVRS